VINLDRQRVVSSNIGSIGYDAISKILEVEFLTGAIYHYFGVPEQLYVQLMSASSHGTFLSQYIKDSYSYARIL
jgi:hypothetical protein